MTDTVPKPRVIHLTIDQAKEAMKDLMRYDAQRSVDSIRISQINDLKSVVDMQRSQLNIIEERERNLKLALDGQTLLINDWKNRFEESEKLRKRSVRAGRFKVVLIGGALAFAIYQSLK
jgi:hypothetical protein